MVENNINLKHLAIIMDGNRRWAKENGVSVKDGHKAGAEKLSEFVKWCIEFNIKYLTVYAFSTENWKRSKEEVDDIMSLLNNYLSAKKDEFYKSGVKVKMIGAEDNINIDTLKKIKDIEEYTKNNNKIQLNIAFNYGGRREILDATKKILNKVKSGEINIEDIDEELFKENLYYGNIPDPDLMIRPGGDYRISNYLLWEMAYSEFYFTKTYWPDFSKELLEEIINNFNTRERRYGGK